MCCDNHLCGVPGLEDNFRSTEELIGALKNIFRKWKDYENTLEATSEMRPLMVHHLSVVGVGLDSKSAKSSSRSLGFRGLQ